MAALVDGFSDLLMEGSLREERNTDLKEKIIRFLELPPWRYQAA